MPDQKTLEATHRHQSPSGSADRVAAGQASRRAVTMRRPPEQVSLPSTLVAGEFERYIAIVASRLTTATFERLETELQRVVSTLGNIIAGGSVSLHLFDDRQQTVLTSYHASHREGSMVWHVSQPVDSFPWSLRDLRWFEKDHVPQIGEIPPRMADERRQALEEYDATSVLNIPLWAGPRQYGALVLASSNDTCRWSESDVTLLKILGQVLANGIAHVRMEQALTQREHRFRAIADYTRDWEDWLDPRGKLLYLNPAVERLTGYSVSECMDMSDYPLGLVHPDDRPVAAEHLARALAGSSGNDIEFRICTKEGAVRWIAVSWQPIYDDTGEYLGTRSSMRDVSRRKAAERRMRAANDILRSLINAAPESAALIDVEGTIVAINETLGNFLGRSRHQLIGKSVIEVLPKGIAMDRKDKGLTVLKTGQPIQYEGYLAGRTMDVQFKPIFDEDGKPYQIAVFARDVTEERRANAQLKEAQANLKARVRERTRELASANEALKEERQLLEAKNAALQEIFKQIEHSKTELSQRIKKNIERAALPVVERLRHHTTEIGTRHLMLLNEILSDIASPLVDSLDAATDKLTPRETEICTMVRNGFSCKQIAESLGVSLQTVLKQRARIRRKLGLAHKKTNLATFLTSLERKRLARRSG